MLRVILFLIAVAGPTFAQVQPTQIREGAQTIHFATIPPGAAEVRVLAPESLGYGRHDGFFLLEFAKIAGPTMALSGGYLSEFSPTIPLGLVRAGGQELNPMHQSWLTTAMFCSTGRSWSVGAAESMDPSQFSDCLQAGPLMLHGGVNQYSDVSNVGEPEMRLLQSMQPQPFLCTDQDGSLVIGVAENGTLLQLIAALQSRLRCVNAMRLSGSDMTGLWSQSGGLVGSSSIRLANAIAVFQ
jgi:hypothetical protein